MLFSARTTRGTGVGGGLVERPGAGKSDPFREPAPGVRRYGKAYFMNHGRQKWAAASFFGFWESRYRSSC